MFFDEEPVDPDRQRLTSEQGDAFRRDGFIVIRGLASPSLCRDFLSLVHDQLAAPFNPVEFEADLGYPGAPADRAAEGGATIRRLRQAIDRDSLFTTWATDPPLLTCLGELLGPDLVLSLAHHNCIMTKQPKFSSVTGWHQDFRYWSFQRPELVSVWLALGPERDENGRLEFIPGSHNLTLSEDRFDERRFFREDLPQNQALIAKRQSFDLEAGDVVLFHCLTLHTAGANRTDATKFSVVLTYRPADNPPLPGSRSASLPELTMPVIAGAPSQRPTRPNRP